MAEACVVDVQHQTLELLALCRVQKTRPEDRRWELRLSRRRLRQEDLKIKRLLR